MMPVSLKMIFSQLGLNSLTGRPALVAKPQLRQNLRVAKKHWRQALAFGFIWAAFLSIHSFTNLYLHGWQNLGSIARFSFLVFVGTSLGGIFGWLCAIVLSSHRIPPKCYAVGFVVILITTIGLTAGLFALQYRLYYAQWHSTFFSIGWFFQFAFTTASALYLFAVQGLRTLLPFGPFALAVAAWMFMKSGSSTDHLRK